MRKLGAALLAGILSSTAVYGQEKSTLRYEIRSEKPDYWWIDQIKNSCEKAPDFVKRKINAIDGKVVIFDGIVTDQPELRQFKGKQVKDADLTYDYDVVVGMQLSNRAYVKQTIYRFPGSVSVCLHELGHMVDEYFGNLSSTKKFTDAFEEDLPNSRKFYGMRDPAQVWAEGFAIFHESEDFNSRFRFSYPKLYQYFVDFRNRYAKR